MLLTEGVEDIGFEVETKLFAKVGARDCRADGSDDGALDVGAFDGALDVGAFDGFKVGWETCKLR